VVLIDYGKSFPLSLGRERLVFAERTSGRGVVDGRKRTEHVLPHREDPCQARARALDTALAWKRERGDAGKAEKKGGGGGGCGPASTCLPERLGGPKERSERHLVGGKDKSIQL